METELSKSQQTVAPGAGGGLAAPTLLADLNGLARWARGMAQAQQANCRHAVENCEYGDAARLMGEAQAYEYMAKKLWAVTKEHAHICPECGGTGGVDSGGETPWGAGIMLPCPSCSGYDRVKELKHKLDKALNDYEQAMHRVAQLESANAESSEPRRAPLTQPHQPMLAANRGSVERMVRRCRSLWWAIKPRIKISIACQWSPVWNLKRWNKKRKCQRCGTTFRDMEEGITGGDTLCGECGAIVYPPNDRAKPPRDGDGEALERQHDDGT